MTDSDGCWCGGNPKCTAACAQSQLVEVRRQLKQVMEALELATQSVENSIEIGAPEEWAFLNSLKDVIKKVRGE